MSELLRPLGVYYLYGGTYSPATQAGTPDQTLLQRVQDGLDEMREIAVDVQVRAPTTQQVNVAVEVKAADNYDEETVLERVSAALSGWFSGQRLGGDVLLAQLGAVVYGVDGVENYAFTAPAADIAVDESILPVLGTLSVEAMD